MQTKSTVCILFRSEIMNMKKPLQIGEVLIEKELRLVQSASHTGLLAVGSVLGDDALRSSLIDGGSGSDHGHVGHVVVELLHRGLGGGLDHLVAHGLTLGNADTLDSGLNVRHRNFPPDNSNLQSTGISISKIHGDCTRHTKK